MQETLGSGFYLLQPPYQHFDPYNPQPRYQPTLEKSRGAALIWALGKEELTKEASAANDRPGGISLVIVLPENSRISHRVVGVIELTRPRWVLPRPFVSDVQTVVALLRSEPDRLPDEFVDFLIWRGLRLDRETQRIIRRTVELSGNVHTLEALARSVYLSRRALGRRFQRLGLPVPSHWLQVSRLLRACARLQSSDVPLARLASEFGYPDAFTLSNQMERLLGVRPSVARKRLGWEWLAEEWLRREFERDGLRVPLRGLRAVQSRSRPQPEGACRDRSASRLQVGL